MLSFALLETVRELSEIPFKFNILRRTPSFITDWYIKKFNPFIAEKAQCLGEDGFLVKMPITAEQARQNPGYFTEMSERTLYTLKDYDVDIVLPPMGLERDFPDVITKADGRNVFPFFIMPAVLKALNLVGKNIKEAELVLIDGERGITLNVLDNIYPHVNYLTVITESPEDYDDKISGVFDDCGLNMQAASYNRTGLTNADIIINTKKSNNKYDHYYKRGAIYFDLSGDALELPVKRPDMLVIDGLRLNGGMGLGHFECGLYVLSREYRSLIRKHYDSRPAALIAERLRGYSISGLQLNNKTLTAANLAGALRKAGLNSIKTRGDGLR